MNVFTKLAVVAALGLASVGAYAASTDVTIDNLSQSQQGSRYVRSPRPVGKHNLSVTDQPTTISLIWICGEISV